MANNFANSINSNIGVANSGATNTLTVTNPSNTASSQALVNVTVGGTSAGDAFTTYTVAGTTNWSQGVDNSVTGDPFVLAASTALGTTNVMSASTAGEVNWPLQPAFMAYLAATATNKTGTGTNYTIGTDALTEVFDQGSDFNTNGTFTAPITGRYQLNSTVRLVGCTVATIISHAIVTSNRTYSYSWGRTASPADLAACISQLCDMDAGDTATFTVLSVGEAGDTDDVSGNATNMITGVSGFLVA